MPERRANYFNLRVDDIWGKIRGLLGNAADSDQSEDSELCGGIDIASAGLF